MEHLKAFGGDASISELLLLESLASHDLQRCRAAAVGLFSKSSVDRAAGDEPYDLWHERLRAEWRRLGPAGSRLVPGLLRNLISRNTDLLTMAALAMALATQGEDGAGELLPLLKSEDFTIRHMAAVGLSLLDRSGRWAVQTLLQALAEEDQPLIVANLTAALGRIGGQGAILGMARMLEDIRRSSEPDANRCELIEEGLRATIAGSMLGGPPHSR